MWGKTALTVAGADACRVFALCMLRRSASSTSRRHLMALLQVAVVSLADACYAPHERRPQTKEAR